MFAILTITAFSYLGMGKKLAISFKLLFCLFWLDVLQIVHNLQSSFPALAIQGFSQSNQL